MSRSSQDLDANESAYLSHVLELYRAGLDAFPLVDPKLMRRQANGAILEAAVGLKADGVALSELEILKRLREAGRGLSEETVYTATTYTAKDSLQLSERARWILEDHENRKLRNHSLQMSAAIEAGDLQRYRDLASELSSEGADDKAYRVMTAHDTATAAMNLLLDSLDNHKSRVRMTDPELAHGLGTLGAGTLTIIGADTGVGKSTLALYMARTTRVPVGIVSLEDPPEVYGARILSPFAGVSASVIFTGEVGNHETMKMLGDGVDRVGPLPTLAFAVGAPMPDVLSAIRALVQRHGCKLIIVDYLQAIRIAATQDRRIAIADATSQMKALCAKLGAALVCCSQLSRPPSDVKFREPLKHHLKESGDVENMAEAIILLWQLSDKPGSDVFGKIAKLKWGVGGHRFRFIRDNHGNLRELGQWIDPQQQQPNHQEGREW